MKNFMQKIVAQNLILAFMLSMSLVSLGAMDATAARTLDDLLEQQATERQAYTPKEGRETFPQMLRRHETERMALEAPPVQPKVVPSRPPVRLRVIREGQEGQAVAETPKPSQVAAVERETEAGRTVITRASEAAEPVLEGKLVSSGSTIQKNEIERVFTNTFQGALDEGVIVGIERPGQPIKYGRVTSRDYYGGDVEIDAAEGTPLKTNTRSSADEDNSFTIYLLKKPTVPADIPSYTSLDNLTEGEIVVVRRSPKSGGGFSYGTVLKDKTIQVGKGSRAFDPKDIFNKKVVDAAVAKKTAVVSAPVEREAVPAALTVEQAVAAKKAADEKVSNFAYPSGFDPFGNADDPEKIAQGEAYRTRQQLEQARAEEAQKIEPAQAAAQEGQVAEEIPVKTPEAQRIEADMQIIATTDATDYHAILNIQPDASLDQITDAYNKLKADYDPTKNYKDIVAGMTAEDKTAFVLKIYDSYGKIENAYKNLLQKAISDAETAGQEAKLRLTQARGVLSKTHTQAEIENMEVIRNIKNEVKQAALAKAQATQREALQKVTETTTNKALRYKHLPESGKADIDAALQKAKDDLGRANTQLRIARRNAKGVQPAQVLTASAVLPTPTQVDQVIADTHQDLAKAQAAVDALPADKARQTVAIAQQGVNYAAELEKATAALQAANERVTKAEGNAENWSAGGAESDNVTELKQAKSARWIARKNVATAWARLHRNKILLGTAIAGTAAIAIGVGVGVGTKNSGN